MSNTENARVTDAIAKNVGIRWCTSCNSDKPAEGFKKQGVRWICAGCLQRRKDRTPGSWMQGGMR